MNQANYFSSNKKNYNNDEFTKGQWDMLDSFLSDKVVRRLTIFGYGAPSSDVEAIQVLNKAREQESKEIWSSLKLLMSDPKMS